MPLFRTNSLVRMVRPSRTTNTQAQLMVSSRKKPIRSRLTLEGNVTCWRSSRPFMTSSRCFRRPARSNSRFWAASRIWPSSSSAIWLRRPARKFSTCLTCEAYSTVSMAPQHAPGPRPTW